MIPQLWDIGTKVKKRVEEGGGQTRWLALSDKRALLEAAFEGKSYWISAIEHFGPIEWPKVESLITRLGEDKHIILLTTGSSNNSIIGEIIRQPARGRIALIAMGLTDYADTEFKAKRFGETASPLFKVVEGIFEEKGIKLEEITCTYCDRKVLTACNLGQSLLCKDHFISCPLCRVHLCHPDVKDCYFHHRC